MKKTNWTLRATGSFALSLGVALFASMNSVANSLTFSEDFSGDLAGWTGKNGGSHQGLIVSDPFDSGNKVLSFSGLNLSGDIFTSALLPVGTHGQTIVSFDYLGLQQSGSVAGNLGGFLGVSIDLVPEGGDAAWIAGTELSAVNGLGFSGIELLDDGHWRRYEVDITSILSQNNISAVHLMLEDWRDAGGVAGDAYFDNVQVKVASVPDLGSTANLLFLTLIVLLITKSNRVLARQLS